MKITNNQNQPSFKALNLPSKEAFGKPGEILFEAMRNALTPKEGNLLSDLHELAEKADVFIKPTEDMSKIEMSVRNGNVTVRENALSASSYSEPVSLGNAITQAVKSMYLSSRTVRAPKTYI